MTQETYHKNTRGHIKITKFNAQGDARVIVDRANLILANSDAIVAKLLGGTANWNLDRIGVYKATSLIIANSITSVSYPATNSVKFAAYFSTSDFNDTIDEVRLASAIGGDFSQVTGLSVTKDSTQELLIEWTIIIN